MLTIERALHEWRTRNVVRPPPPPPLSDAALMASRYAEDYRKLIALGRDARRRRSRSRRRASRSTPTRPREVKDFYGAVFKPIDDIIAANAAHNRMVRLLGREQDAPVVEAIASLDGDWDDDLYLDIVHFTERGNARVARAMFEALLPILASAGRALRRAVTERCRSRTRRRSLVRTAARGCAPVGGRRRDRSPGRSAPSFRPKCEPLSTSSSLMPEVSRLTAAVAALSFVSTPLASRSGSDERPRRRSSGRRTAVVRSRRLSRGGFALGSGFGRDISTDASSVTTTSCALWPNLASAAASASAQLCPAAGRSSSPRRTAGT